MSYKKLCDVIPIYEFKIEKEHYNDVIEQINENRISDDFVNDCFKTASRYRKVE